jgi:hypothetical protein
MKNWQSLEEAIWDSPQLAHLWAFSQV